MPPGLSDPDCRPPEVDGCCSVQPTSLGPLLPQELERHVDAFNLAEPVFARCPFAAMLQIGLKVVEPANHGWLDLQDRASEAGVFVLTGGVVGGGRISRAASALRLRTRVLQLLSRRPGSRRHPRRLRRELVRTVVCSPRSPVPDLPIWRAWEALRISDHRLPLLNADGEQLRSDLLPEDLVGFLFVK
jgi:hypothetical protein